MKKQNKYGKGWLAFGVFILLTLVVAHPIFSNFDNYGLRDWDTVAHFQEAARITLLEYHQLPLWDPWLNGGVPLLADPTSTIPSPLFILSLVFGTIHGLKVQIMLWYLIGFAGVYLLCRQLKISELPSMIGAATYMLSSWMSLHWAAAAYGVCAISALIPWVVYFFDKSNKNRINGVYAGGVLAVGVFSGVLHMLPIVMTGLLVYAFVSKNLKSFTVMVACVFCFSAVKLIPALEYVLSYPRVVGDYYCNGPGLWWGYSTQHLYYSLIGSYQMPFVSYGSFNSSVWEEYGMYVGPVCLLLALIGLACCWRKNKGLVFFGVVGLAVAMGSSESSMPVWRLLHNLPLYSFLRVPARWMILFLFSLSIFTAYGAGVLIKKRRIFGVLLFIVISINLLWVSYLPFTDTFVLKPVVIAGGRGNLTHVSLKYNPPSMYTQLFPLTRANVGETEARASLRSLSCRPTSVVPSGYGVPYSVLTSRSELIPNNAYVGDMYMKSNGVINSMYWSPNFIQINASSATGDILVVNQNYDQGWAGVNKSVNVLWTDVPAGESIVTLSYLPLSFIMGAAVTLLSILLCWRWLKRK